MKKSGTLLQFSLAAVILNVVSISSHAQEWTDSHVRYDWGDHDYGCSPGSVPQESFCNQDHVGHVAVCWQNRRTGECGGATAWCTYKTITEIMPRGVQPGSSPGEVWVCGTSWLAPARPQIGTNFRSRTVKTLPDGGKEVIEGKRHYFYGADGKTPRGINRVCESYEGIGHCWYNGPTYYDEQ
jgi:hypothetical protein